VACLFMHSHPAKVGSPDAYVHPAGAPPAPHAKDMVELFAPLRGLNLDFERDRDTGRDINL